MILLYNTILRQFKINHFFDFAYLGASSFYDLSPEFNSAVFQSAVYLVLYSPSLSFYFSFDYHVLSESIFFSVLPGLYNNFYNGCLSEEAFIGIIVVVILLLVVVVLTFAIPLPTFAFETCFLLKSPNSKFPVATTLNPPLYCIFMFKGTFYGGEAFRKDINGGAGDDYGRCN